MSELSKETLELYLKDEQERADKCEDEYTKNLLLNRIASYERLLKEFENA